LNGNTDIKYTHAVAKNCDDALLVYEYLASPLKNSDY